jgi:hypothetical protein
MKVFQFISIFLIFAPVAAFTLSTIYMDKSVQAQKIPNENNGSETRTLVGKLKNNYF